MKESPNALVVDLLQWLVAGPRPYAEVMEAWRTSCPRLTIWEDAVELGLVCRQRSEKGIQQVELTEVGRETLRCAGTT
ncbi:hypothetical protein [Bradyrhizobium sp. 2TAF24]|uniref:hypothetical protein n=1 Tax=Bradyrhizobium sp. 2TAF24 TaxID=3233011 RepID=UPI003F8EE108